MQDHFSSFVIKGDLCDSADPTHFRTLPNGYLVCVDGICAGVFPVLPGAYVNLPFLDFSGDLILPGFTDLHVHAPQYAFRGIGMDLELLDWLSAHVFPEESRYVDRTYAKSAYSIFVNDLKHSVTTRACIFATVHREATEWLMESLENSGLIALVGKVNMDQNCPESLREKTASSLSETRRWLQEVSGKFRRVGPILTPRFVPSCTAELLQGLGSIAAETGLPVQSHLSENRGEVELVGQLHPDRAFYGDVYDHFGLFGKYGKIIMAHGVLSDSREIALMKERGVYLAHCPQSNENLASGIAPVRRFLDGGVSVGLGTDVAGGASLSMLRAVADAVQVSKLYWRLVDETQKPLSVAEAFWMATAGGGSFFGKVGCFQDGFELDAVVLDDARFSAPYPLSIAQRCERAISLAEDRDVKQKFVRGRAVL